MPEKQQQILDTLERVIPHMSENKKEHLLGYAEGIEAAVERQREKKEAN